MKPEPGPHLNAREALDYLEHALAPRRVAEVEAHLAAPCPACRESLRRFARLLSTMRADRPERVPAEIRRRATELLVPSAQPAPNEGLRAAVARLLFDSWSAPLPAAVRRAVGEARRLRWQLADGALEVEIEAESDGAVTVRGSLESPDPALLRIEAGTGDERFEAWPDAGGAFAFERLPAGALDFTVIGAGRIERIPTVLP